MGTILVQVDWENNSDWWDAARDAVCIKPRPALPDAFVDFLLGGDESVELPERDAKVAEAWSQTIPGWDNGIDRAPHPLLFTESWT